MPARDYLRLPALDARYALARALRAALATVLPLYLAWHLGKPELSWAALGGWLSALADPGGSRSFRAFVLFSFAALASALIVAGLAASGTPLATAALLVAVTFAGSMLRALGSSFAAVGTLCVVITAVSSSGGAHMTGHASVAALTFMLGASWSIVLTSVVWPVWTHWPLRSALGDVFTELARYANALARSNQPKARHHHRPIRDALERSREVSLALRANREGESILGSNLRAVYGAAETSFYGLVALAETSRDPRALADLAAKYSRTAVLLRRASLPNEEPTASGAARASHDALLAHLQNMASAALQVAAAPTKRWALASTRNTRLFEPHPIVREAKSQIRAALSPRSAHFRHAVRVTCTIAVAFALGRWLSPAHVAWVTVTSLAILQPQPGLTLRRALERALGTILGCLATAAVMLGVHSPAWLASLMFVFATLAIVARPHSYPLFTFFLTPVFVLFLDAGRGNLAMALERATDSVLGAGLAVLAALVVFPSWEKTKLSAALITAVRSLQTYANVSFEVLAEPRSPEIAARLDSLRSSFGLASNEAEASLERVLSEPHRDKRGVHDAMQLLTYLRRLASAFTALDVHREVADPAPMAPNYADLRAHVHAMLTQIEHFCRTGTTTQPSPMAFECASDPVFARIERTTNMMLTTLTRGNLVLPLRENIV